MVVGKRPGELVDRLVVEAVDKPFEEVAGKQLEELGQDRCFEQFGLDIGKRKWIVQIEPSRALEGST